LDRGTKQSYQKWADEVGDQSYTFDNLLPFFQKSVTFEPPNNNIRPLNSTPGYDAASFGNTGGPLHVSFPNWSNAVSTWIIKALTELGLSPVKGFTSGSLLGFQYATQTLNRNKQTRDSSQTSFLRKALAETRNLAVYERTLAKKINFDANNRATGVVIEKYGVRSTLYAKKEVILSAGAFRSPQMLMVSGVGPAATLQKLNIPVVADRPGVGQNMWDHVLFGPAYQVNLVTHSSLSNNPAFYGQQIVNYNTNRTGMLTNTASEFLGWEKLPAKYRKNLTQATLDGLATFPADWPEIELIFLDAWAGLEQDFLTGAPQDNNQYASVSCGIITPFSRGSVTINSTDTSDNPVVSPNLLSDPRDQDIAVQAFKRAREIIATKSLAPIRITQESFPGLNVSTDAQILDLIKQSALTIYHASATNKMGKVTDPMAVVDSHARVIGVQGLRVVDISAFPFLVPGHPQASVCV
jgi:choline dehydrogenase